VSDTNIKTIRIVDRAIDVAMELGMHVIVRRTSGGPFRIYRTSYSGQLRVQYELDEGQEDDVVVEKKGADPRMFAIGKGDDHDDPRVGPVVREEQDASEGLGSDTAILPQQRLVSTGRNDE
jgi:hypothetical protein